MEGDAFEVRGSQRDRGDGGEKNEAGLCLDFSVSPTPRQLSDFDKPHSQFFSFFRSNGHEPIVAAPPLECPGAPLSFYRINSGLDFRPLCQDSHRNHHRGLCRLYI